MSKKLNLGCGNDIREGWVNLDSATLQGVDVVWDVEKLPLPFEDDTFEEILCQDILEHVEYIPILQDLHRILKKDGILTIRVPHFTSVNNFIDPTHKKRFSIRTFDFFTKNSLHGRNYYFDFFFSGIIMKRFHFQKGILHAYNYLMEFFVNINRFTQIYYEDSGLSRIFPAGNIIIKIKK